MHRGITQHMSVLHSCIRLSHRALQPVENSEKAQNRKGGSWYRHASLRSLQFTASQGSSVRDLHPTYLWLVGNGGMGYNFNYYYYHSSIPYLPKVGLPYSNPWTVKILTRLPTFKVSMTLDAAIIPTSEAHQSTVCQNIWVPARNLMKSTHMKRAEIKP